MSKTYCLCAGHEFVSVKGTRSDTGEPLARPAPVAVPYEIVLYCGSHVFIAATYADEIENAVQVGDGRCKSFDEQGNCILSVPAEQCTDFWTAEEYGNILAMMDADEQLLRYAI